MLKIFHASDLQIGKPYRPDVAEAMVRMVEEQTPDLVVVAGDLTQRAKVREYRVARTLLSRLGPGPVVVTPGNHDVPLYRFWERLFDPYRNWRRFVRAELDHVMTMPGAVVVALNSSAPRRAIVNGRLHPPQMAFARDAFARAGESDIRVLVVHHHFVATDDGSGGHPLPAARAHLEAFEEMDVDLLLGGHVHQTRVIPPGDPRTGVRFPLISCGTSTSSRGRGVETDLNTLNVLEAEGTQLRVRPYRYAPERGAFEPVDEVVVPRRSPAPAPRDDRDRAVGGRRGDA